MADRDKIIKAWEIFRENNPYEICSGREFRAIREREPEYYMSQMIEDTIALLKEQEAVEPDTDSEGTCSCGNCGETVGYYPVGCNNPHKFAMFCPNCGRSVKWE